MVSPGPVNPHRLPMDRRRFYRAAPKATRVLRTFGFHVLAVLLGIALAFM